MVGALICNNENSKRDTFGEDNSGVGQRKSRNFEWNFEFQKGISLKTFSKLAFKRNKNNNVIYGNKVLMLV